jgi:predicted CXXCH cytochrome family protein
MALGGYAAVALALHDDAAAPWATPLRLALLPGATSHGHHQIELACRACHKQPFGGGDVLQEACTGCHGQALDAADDKHPARKFEDPRNAFRLEKIDGLRCVTCHVEHRPQATRAMGVTQAADYCFHCHSGKDEMPPSHDGLAFDGCTACHNYHDNRALYEDYLLRHAKAPELLERRAVPLRGLLEALQASASYPQQRYPFEPVPPARADAPPAWREGTRAARHAEALDTAHARAGVNCSGCHQAAGADAPWVARPTASPACEGCHATEAKGLRAGRHGMREAVGLAPMTPADARLPMRADAAHRTLQCTSCHGAHRFDTGLAASVDACLGCHADRHSLAYRDSPHFVLAQREARGEAEPGSGVTCATCHMPRERIDTDDGSRVAVQHDNSATMRPFSKMVRPVCQHCHGLGFTLDALSDPALAARNFSGRPAARHRSIAMALDKAAAVAARRAASAPTSAATP